MVVLRGHLNPIACALAAIACAAAPASADTASDTMTVSATVLAACTILADPLAFGAYDPAVTTALDAASSVEVTCTNGTTYEVAIDAGLGAGATVAQRRMTQGGATLVYSLYRNAARTQVWGQTSGSDVATGTGTGAAQTLSVYGRAPASQAVTPGAYADTVTVTVSY